MALSYIGEQQAYRTASRRHYSRVAISFLWFVRGTGLHESCAGLRMQAGTIVLRKTQRRVIEIRSVGGGEDSRARELIPFARGGFIPNSDTSREMRSSRGENFSRSNSRYISTDYLICFSQQNNRRTPPCDRELNALWSAINGEGDKTARALAYIQL